MNGKASVSKELDSRHSKILEGLLKLPGNRECADCKSRAPRWASVNLGIFICMHCSGIHRSLGVHISQVRSTTLDTWLPDQVSSMQAMGNEKSNGYWEAELPPGYDRSSVETFIRAKYGEKRWISKEGCVSNDIPIISSYSQKRQQAYKSVEPFTTSDLSTVTEHTQPPWNSQAERKLSNSILLDVRATDVPKEKTHRPSSKGNWASFDSVTGFKDTPDGMDLIKDSNRRRATSADENSDWAIFDCFLAEAAVAQLHLTFNKPLEFISSF